MASISDYQSLNSPFVASTSNPLMEIPGVTSPAYTPMTSMSASRSMPMDYRASLYSDAGYGSTAPGLPVPDSSLIGQSAGQGMFDGMFDSLGLSGLKGIGSSINDFMENSGIMGKTLSDGTRMAGWGNLALGGVQTLGNLFMGWQNYNLMKDQLNFQKDAFNKNWSAQKSLTNSSLEDRQRARVASSGVGAYESVGSYMAKNGIK